MFGCLYEAQENFDIEIQGTISITFDLTKIPSDSKFIDTIDIMLEESKIEIENIDDISLINQEY